MSVIEEIKDKMTEIFGTKDVVSLLENHKSPGLQEIGKNLRDIETGFLESSPNNVEAGRAFFSAIASFALASYQIGLIEGINAALVNPKGALRLQLSVLADSTEDPEVLALIKKKLAEVDSIPEIMN